jgi:hypothetical protein
MNMLSIPVPDELLVLLVPVLLVLLVPVLLVLLVLVLLLAAPALGAVAAAAAREMATGLVYMSSPFCNLWGLGFQSGFRHGR